MKKLPAIIIFLIAIMAWQSPVLGLPALGLIGASDPNWTDERAGRGRQVGGVRIAGVPVAVLGSVPGGASVGNRARGLLGERRRLGLLSA